MNPKLLDEIVEKVVDRSLDDFQISAFFAISLQSVAHLRAKHYDHFVKVPDHVAEGWSTKLDYILR